MGGADNAIRLVKYARNALVGPGSNVTCPISVDLRPAQFEDRYESALVDVLKKKEAGEKIEPAKAGPAPRVFNLMDALRASIDAAQKKAPASSVQARLPAKRKASQKWLGNENERPQRGHTARAYKTARPAWIDDSKH